MISDSTLESLLSSTAFEDNLGSPRNLTDAIFAVSESIERHTNILCSGSMDEPGAIEHFSVVLSKCGESIAGGLHAIADAINAKE